MGLHITGHLQNDQSEYELKDLNFVKAVNSGLCGKCNTNNKSLALHKKSKTNK